MTRRQPPVAILATACRFPDAADVRALWSNVLAGRRSFRPIPPQRLDLAAYGRLGGALDITRIKAGLLTGWRFDRGRFRIPGAAYEATDLAHWLALDVAAEALAAFEGFERFDRKRIAVVVANTLTGEFSRASALAMRAPFFDEVLAEAASACGLDDSVAGAVRAHFAGSMAARLPTPNEDTLAGSLANTIAGRIANYFDLHGGAFTVDAACASSLVAVAQAADLLATGRVDAVLVGAVDLSLDPFELVGFSRVGALAAQEMRVFDARSCGFWPGEGAGFAVLTLAEAAQAQGLQSKATLRGWGLSTDGAGGLIRPTVDGQVLAIERACEGGAVDPGDLDLVEAHGTGTPTGDPVEVQALAMVRPAAAPALPIGSIKANFGHTKAAAGMAGLIKAVESVRAGVVPTHVGCETLHPVFAEVGGAVRVAHAPELIASERAALAGVSSFGFGGVNAHVVIEGPARSGAVVGAVLPPPPRAQDAELFLFAGADDAALAATVDAFRRRADTLAWSEVGDAAAAVAECLADGPARAAVVARTTDELIERLDALSASIAGGQDHIDRRQGFFVARRAAPPRIGFVFPGQAAPVRSDAGAWASRFGSLSPPPPTEGASTDTAYAQPAIVAASLSALDVLERCGIEAQVAVGHSLGELTALAWAGALDRSTLPALAAARGELCARYAEPGGAMVRIDAPRAVAEQLAAGLGLVVACANGEAELVMAGPADAARRFQQAARRAGYEAAPLAVSLAFHSPMMASAVEPWLALLAETAMGPALRAVISTVKGAPIEAGDDLRELLARQLTAPVEFQAALTAVRDAVDLLIEVGPGRGMARLAAASGVAAVSVDAFAASVAPLCEAVGAAFVLGARIDPLALTAGRSLRAIDLERGPDLLGNPCGRRTDAAPPSVALMPLAPPEPVDDPATPGPDGDLLDLVRGVVAAELRLGLDAVGPDDRFDTRLNLESLAVARIVAKAARAAQSPLPRAPTEFAGATSRQLASALEEMRTAPAAVGGDRVDGVARWIRTYDLAWREVQAAERRRQRSWLRMTLDEPLAVAGPSAVLVDALAVDTPDASAALLRRIQELALDPAVRDLAILHAGAPLSGFARSVAREGRFDSVRLIDARHGEANLADALDRDGPVYAEYQLAPAGRLLAPQFLPTAPGRAAAAPIGPDDVALVVGGSRGIAVECALRLAETTGCALLICARSAADSDDVADVLERAALSGTRALYVRADVTDAAALQSALGEAAAVEFGRPTVLIHAPGANQPMRLGAVTGEVLERTLAPKVQGLRNVLAATGAGLTRIYAFGSIIGCLGLEGEAHYAIANAWQSAILSDFASAQPHVLALAIEWSVWDGVGMGDRLGVVARLESSGVDALPVDEGVDAFLRLVTQNAEGAVVATSRFGPPPDLDIGDEALEPTRFIDRKLIHFPSVELVVETDLWLGRDPYLGDHRIADEMTMPGVMALEAMAQAVRQLRPRDAALGEISEVRFFAAMVVPEGGALGLRVCALSRPDGSIAACIRAGDDGFVGVKASAVFGAPQAPRSAPARLPAAAPGQDPPLFDAAPLYGPLFFHGRRFRRLASFRRATSREVVADLAPPPDAGWFGALDLQTLVLGDPGARDAALHALMAAVPYREVVPIAVEQIVLRAGGPAARVRARETWAGEGEYLFDIELEDAEGAVTEYWRGARFRAVGRLEVESVLAAAPQLAAAYLERLAREALQDQSVLVALGDGPIGADQRRRELLARLDAGEVGRRGDGRPADPRVSLSHGGCGLAARASRRIGCDMEWTSAFDGDQPPALMVRSVDDAAPIALGDAWVIGEAIRKVGGRPPFRVRRIARTGLPGDARLYGAENCLIVVASAPSPFGAVLAAIAVEAEHTPQPLPVWETTDA